MSDAKTEIFARIRRANPWPPLDRPRDYAAVPRDYKQSGALGREAVLKMMEERLNDYGAGVFHASRAALPAAIAQVASERGKRCLLIPAGIPREWLPANLEFVVDESTAYTELDASQGALTGCAAAIAMTGSIVLSHSPVEGRRALTLVPDYHLCVVFADQVVETVPEAFRRMHESGVRVMTTIAGPSATADIEMTRIKGVHGPRTLDVILVTG